MTKQISNIEAGLFDIICELHKNLYYPNKENYKAFLVLLDENNEEYKALTGKYYIEPTRCADYYAKLWEF